MKASRKLFLTLGAVAVCSFVSACAPTTPAPKGECTMKDSADKKCCSEKKCSGEKKCSAEKKCAGEKKCCSEKAESCDMGHSAEKK